MRSATTLFRPSVILVAISQLCSVQAWAAPDSARIAELEKTLAKSLVLIERLSSRIEQLEKGPAAPAAPVASGAPADTRMDALERDLAQMAEAANRPLPASQSTPLHGFADVGYASSTRPVADGRKRGFALGNVDLYLTPDLGGRFKTLLELVFEYNDEGALATDLERLQIGYTFSDALTVWAGRFHTPYGYWNTAFHHGAQIQSAILRPKIIAFEDQGGVLPAHTVGLWSTGHTRLANGRLEYDAYVGNGGRILDGVLDFNAVKDDNKNLLVGGNLRYRFGGAMNGLALGLHAFSEKVSTYSATSLDSTTKVNMLGAYGFYDGNDWEVIGEYYGFRDTQAGAGGSKHSSWAGFMQVGKSFGDILPYVRVEKALLDQADNYFLSQNSGRSYQRQALGLRYEIGPKTALKVEMNQTDESGTKYKEAQVQAAIRF